MNTLTPFDWALLIVLAGSALLAFWHGFLVEVCALAGLVAGVVFAGRYYLQLTPWVQRLVHERGPAAAIAFLLVALAVMLAAGLLGRMLRWMLRRVGLGWADRLAGAVFGLVKGYVLAALAVAALVAFFPHQGWMEESKLVAYFMPGAQGSAAVLPRELGVRIQSGLHHLEQAARIQAQRSASPEQDQQ